MPVVGKLYGELVTDCVAETADIKTREHQRVFIKESSCARQSLLIRQFCEKINEKKNKQLT